MQAEGCSLWGDLSPACEQGAAAAAMGTSVSHEAGSSCLGAVLQLKVCCALAALQCSANSPMKGIKVLFFSSKLRTDGCQFKSWCLPSTCCRWAAGCLPLRFMWFFILVCVCERC